METVSAIIAGIVFTGIITVTDLETGEQTTSQRRFETIEECRLNTALRTKILEMQHPEGRFSYTCEAGEEGA